MTTCKVTRGAFRRSRNSDVSRWGLDLGKHWCFLSPMANAKSKTPKKLTKSALLQAIADNVGDGASRKGAKVMLEALTKIGHKELKRNGVFVLPGFAKFVVVKKPARPARQGINPFTKEPTTFAAKPASKAVKARPAKAIKDAIA
jgi:nucleoid DNA-binding protein